MTENHGLLIGIKGAQRTKSPRKPATITLVLLVSALTVTAGLFWSRTQKPDATVPSPVAGESDYRAGKRLFGAAQSTADYVKAASLIGVAASQGNPKAQTAMAVLCFKGLGVAQDHAAAVEWLRKAAVQNFAAAQNELGVLYATGRGVPQDLAQASRWCGLAARQGNQAGKQNVVLLAAATNNFQASLAELERQPYQNLAVQRCDAEGIMVAFEPGKGGVGLARLKSEKSSEPLQQLCGIITERAAAPMLVWTLQNSVVPALRSL